MADDMPTSHAPSREVTPYGSWTSPVTAAQIAEGEVSLGSLQACGPELYWLEMRPLEDGRYVLVRRGPGGDVADVTPRGGNVRTLVHEYGGGAFALHRDAHGTTVFFSEFADQRIYRQEVARDAAPGGPTATGTRPITPDPPAPRALRYADGRVTPNGRWLICVRERHVGDEVVNELVAVPTDGAGEPRVLAAGHDFYAAPRMNPADDRLAWLSWDHPAMPWDETELWVAKLSAAGEIAAPRCVAGGPGESVLQPAWGPDGRLYFISDRSGWWNLYRIDDEAAAEFAARGRPAGVALPATPLAPLPAEFAKPAWVFGLQNYAFLPGGHIVVFWSDEGVDRLGLIDASITPAVGGPLTPIPCAFTALACVAVADGTVAVLGGSPTQGTAVALLDSATGGLKEVRRGSSIEIDPGYVSAPEPIVFPTQYEPGSVRGDVASAVPDVAGAGLSAYALYYAPANHDFAGPPDERPPLLVISHGGPTSAAQALLDLHIQYWTSRGFAVVDVNYGGSTGYGRAYRERLKGNWGIVDTVDCINAARYLASRGDVDPQRIAVRGGSAGGYTTLNALTRHRFFAAGTSYFGLADLEMFVSGGTHKFESQYLLGLVGRYPEEAAVYRERSPINHADEITCPVLVLQGMEDEIVPPRQAEMIVAALEKKGLPYAYLPFLGEQHGFRKAESIVRSLEAELYFYGWAFGFKPADLIAPIEIRNSVAPGTDDG